MLGLRHWSNRRKAALAVALALLLWIPQGISTTNQPVVTGHSTFFNGSGYDPCLASVAGILYSEVRWFNDQILVSHYGGKGTFIYVTENGAPDPTGRAALYTEGVFYDFVDPNGAHWHVEEAFYGEVLDASSGDPGAISTKDPGAATPGVSRDFDEIHYVWIVELSAAPIHDQFAGPVDGPYYHDIYNFVTLVDTCKFHRTEQTNFNGNKHNETTRALDFNITHENKDLEHGHPLNATRHTHEAFLADLWVGKRPVLVPAGVSTQSASWESQWALGYSNDPKSNNLPHKPQNSPGAP